MVVLMVILVMDLVIMKVIPAVKLITSIYPIEKWLFYLKGKNYYTLQFLLNQELCVVLLKSNFVSSNFVLNAPRS